MEHATSEGREEHNTREGDREERMREREIVAEIDGASEDGCYISNIRWDKQDELTLNVSKRISPPRKHACCDGDRLYSEPDKQSKTKQLEC